jgi:hypothetical protein
MRSAAQTGTPTVPTSRGDMRGRSPPRTPAPPHRIRAPKQKGRLSQTPTKRHSPRAQVLRYLRGYGDRGAHSLRWSVERRLHDRPSHQRDGRRSAHRPRPQESAQRTGFRRTTAEMDRIDTLHVAGQGVRIWHGALPDPDQEPRDLRCVHQPDRCGKPQPTRQHRGARAGGREQPARPCAPGPQRRGRSQRRPFGALPGTLLDPGDVRRGGPARMLGGYAPRLLKWCAR